MANKLAPTVRAYLQGSNISRRYIRVTDMTEEIKKQYTSFYENLVMDNSYTTEEYTKMLAVAAGALYKLPRIEIIHKERFDFCSKCGKNCRINLENKVHKKITKILALTIDKC